MINPVGGFGCMSPNLPIVLRTGISSGISDELAIAFITSVSFSFGVGMCTGGYTGGCDGRGGS